MRVVLQRVKEASISIDGAPAQSIGPGLVLLFGVREGDTPDLIPKLAKKCANMRIFSDDEGRMNLSAVQLGYSALAASNFTLYANTDKGMRPSSPPSWNSRASKRWCGAVSGRICRSPWSTTARSPWWWIPTTGAIEGPIPRRGIG